MGSKLANLIHVTADGETDGRSEILAIGSLDLISKVDAIEEVVGT